MALGGANFVPSDDGRGGGNEGGGRFTRARTTQGRGRVGAGPRDILYRGREYQPATKSSEVVELQAEVVEQMALTDRPHVEVRARARSREDSGRQRARG